MDRALVPWLRLGGAALPAVVSWIEDPHAVVIQIEGNSYRLRAHQDLMPEVLVRPQNPDQPRKRKRGRPRKETR